MIARSLLVAVALPLLLISCRKSSVEAYRIPKEKDSEMPMAANAPMSGGSAPGPANTAPTGNTMASTAVPTADGAGLAWTAPAGWKQKPAGPMRKATYLIPVPSGGEAELSITAFPGDVGGELANVNRWRGQVQLPPIGDSDLSSQVQRLDKNGLQFGIVDCAGTGQDPQRIVGAFVPFGAATWFFKVLGPDAATESVKPAFLSFLETVKPAAQ